ncbi:hypothetical protein GCM10010123_34450 [Pilimelia anulata]|uniref:Lipoprotein n=1 Tax=Pilimelia anulata TaxID=53371 RepID=A0A8J3B8A9_9ACTN|nr:hypothetical protein [Pilimelia anulata]GGK01694.1 hypothetical protein GCM10010123_34450 [Pilimelia anulata]
MKRIDRRAVPPALAGLLAALLLAAAGCTAAGTGGGQAAGRARTPQEALQAAAPDRSGGSFRYTLADPDSTGTGVLDPRAGRGLIEINQREPGDDLVVKTGFLKIGPDLWTRITPSRRVPGFPVPDKWLRIDPAKVTSTDLLAEFAADPTGAAALAARTGGVTADPSGYRGTVDLTALGGVELVPPARVTALGPKAAAVPFEAVVDAEQRLSKLTVRVPAAGRAKAYERVSTYGDYGAAAIPAAPTAAIDAPAGVYDLLNK